MLTVITTIFIFRGINVQSNNRVIAQSLIHIVNSNLTYAMLIIYKQNYIC